MQDITRRRFRTLLTSPRNAMRGGAGSTGDYLVEAHWHCSLVYATSLRISFVGLLHFTSPDPTFAKLS